MTLKKVVSFLLLLQFALYGELPESARVQLEEAVGEARGGAIEPALEKLDEIARAYPAARSVTHDRIVLLTWAERDNDAVFLYEYAIAYPDELPLYVAQALAGSYRRLGDTEGMLAITDEILSRDPFSKESHMLLAAYYETIGEPARALGVYNQWLREDPDDEEAIDGRLRTLLQVSATGAVLNEIASHPNVHPSLRFQAMGDQVAFYLRAGDLRRTEVLLERNEDITRNRDALNDDNAVEKEFLDNLALRTLFDRILLEERRENTQRIIEIYEDNESDGIAFPLAVRLVVAGAYLSEKQAGKALDFYRDIHLELKSEGRDAEFSEQGIYAIMGMYWANMELQRPSAAEENLKYLEENVPPFVHWLMDHQPVWERMSIDLERGWWLLYQNRLLQSERHFRDVLARAPRNSGPWASLGTNLRAQGRSAEAAQTLEMAVRLDPENAGARVGLALAYSDLGRRQDAERILRELKNTRYAQNSNVLDLEKELKLRRSPRLEASFLNDEYYSIGGAAPLAGSWELEAQRVWQEKARDRFFFDVVGVSDEQLSPLASTDRIRWYLGTAANFGENGRLRAGASYEEKLNTPGGAIQYELPLTGRVSIATGFNSNSGAAPVVGEVEGWDGYAFGSIRYGNRWSAYIGSGYLNLNDENDRWEAYAGQSLALYLDQTTFLTLALDANTTQWDFESPNYYSVTSIFTGYMPLILRHAFYQRNDSRFGTELAVGPGYKWEKEFDGGFIWFVRGQLEADVHQWLSVILGASYSLNRYSGVEENQNDWFGSLLWRF